MSNKKTETNHVITLQEEELIEGCIAGKRSAQNRLFDKYAPKMLGVCYRYAQTEHDAEDIMQDGFVKVFKNLSKFRRESSLETWIRRVMINTALNFLKATQKLRMQADIEVAENDANFSISQWNTMDTQLIMDCIHSLPVGYRVVLNMFAIEGYSHKEIAQELAITESTSRSQFARAKVLLKKKIDAINNFDQHYERRRVQ